jgi:tight adherence protein B
MDTGLLLAIAIIAAACIGVPLLLATSRRNKRLTDRLAATVEAGQPVRPRAAPTIRVIRRPRSRLQGLAALFKVPLDVRLAHIVPPPLVFAASAAIGAAAWSMGRAVLSPPVAAVIAAGVALAACRGVFDWEMGLYRAKLVAQLPDTVQLVVTATRAGLPVSEAFRAIADEMPSPTKDEFARVCKSIALGEPADQALLELHRRTGVPEYAIFAVTIGVQSRSGGRLAETMQTLAETVRERLSIIARAKAVASESKVSAVIMCALPVVSAAWMSVTQPHRMALLINDPRGIRLLVIGIATMILGILTMRHLIAGISRD